MAANESPSYSNFYDLASVFVKNYTICVSTNNRLTFANSDGERIFALTKKLF